MVAVTDKDEIKRRFSERLNELLDASGAQERGRPYWLSKTFEESFSAEAARKWLQGESIPDQAHISMLCTYFQWSANYLMTGHGPRFIATDDPATIRMIEKIPQLEEAQREYLLQTIQMLLDNQAKAPKAPEPRKPRVHPSPPKRQD